MVLKLTESGRRKYNSLPPELKKRFAEKITARNRFSAKAKPAEEENPRSFWDKTKSVAKGAWEGTKSFATELDKESSKDPWWSRGANTFGRILLGGSKGVVRTFKDAATTISNPRALVGNEDEDATDFMQWQERQKGYDYNERVTSANSAGEKPAIMIGQELPQILAGGAIAEGASGLSALGRFATVGAAEGAMEYLRKGDLKTSAVAAGLGGLGGLLTKKAAPILKKAGEAEGRGATWLERAVYSGRQELDMAGDAGKDLRKHIEAFDQIKEELDVGIRKAFKDMRPYQEFAGLEAKGVARKFMEGRATIKELAVDVGEVLAKKYEKARKVLTPYFKHTNAENIKNGIGSIADGYFPRQLADAGRKALLKGHSGDAVESLVKNGWDAEVAQKFVTESRAAKDVTIEEVLSNLKKDFAGKKGFSKSRTEGLSLPDEWLENDISKVVDKYTRDWATENAARRVFGENKGKFHQLIEGAKASGLKEGSARQIAEGMFRPGPTNKISQKLMQTHSLLSLVKAWMTGTIPELVVQATRVGNKAMLKSIVSEVGNVLSGRFKKLALSRGLTDSVKQMAPDGGGILGWLSENAPHMKAFKAFQASADRINVKANVLAIEEIFKKAQKKALSLKQIERFKAQHGAPAYARLFNDAGKAKDITKKTVQKVAEAAYVVKAKPTSVLNSPLAWKATDAAKMATQYKQFGYPVAQQVWASISKGTLTQKAKSITNLFILGYAAQAVMKRGAKKQKELVNLMYSALGGNPPEQVDIETTNDMLADIFSVLDTTGTSSIIMGPINNFKYAKNGYDATLNTIAGPSGKMALALLTTAPYDIIKALDDPNIDLDMGKILKKTVKNTAKTTPTTKGLYDAFLATDKEKASKLKWQKKYQKKAEAPGAIEQILQKFSPPENPPAPKGNGETFFFNPQEISGGNTAEKAFNMIKKFEGYREDAYGDYKQFSIGYGTKSSEGGKTTPEQAKNDALKHINKNLVKINSEFPDLKENQKIALADFMYNLGEAPEGAEKLYKLIKDGASKKKIARLWIKFNKAGGKTLPALVKRRAAEIKMFLS